MFYKTPQLAASASPDLRSTPLVTGDLSSRSLGRNFSWSILGNVIYSACQWAILVIFARAGTVEMVGQFSIALAISAPIVMLCNLQLRAVYATDFKEMYSFGDYFGLRLLTTALATIITVGIAFWAGYRGEMSAAILIVGLAKALESCSDIFFGLFQKQGRIDYIAISMGIKGLLSLGTVAIGVYTTGSVVGGVIGLLLAWLVVFLLYDLKVTAGLLEYIQMTCKKSPELWYFCPRWNGHQAATLAWISLPLGIGMGLISLNTNIPRYFIEYHLGPAEVGGYAAIASMLLMGSTLMDSLGRVVVPNLAHHYTLNNRYECVRLLMVLMGFAAIVGIGGIAVSWAGGGFFLSAFFGAEYEHYTDALFWLMIAAAAFYMASGLRFAMTAVRCFRLQVPLAAITAGVIIIGCYLWVPSDGLQGAAFALLLAMLIQILLSSIVMWQVLLAPINGYFIMNANVSSQESNQAA